MNTEQLSMLGISRLLDIMILLELSTGATQCWKAFLFFISPGILIIQHYNGLCFYRSHGAVLRGHWVGIVWSRTRCIRYVVDIVFTARIRNTGEGNVFTVVCLSTGEEFTPGQAIPPTVSNTPSEKEITVEPSVLLVRSSSICCQMLNHWRV